METINLTKDAKHYLKAAFNEKKCEVEDLLSSIESNLKPALCKELNTCNNSISGKLLKIACNCDNLLEALNTFESEELNLNYNDSLRPFTITSDSEVNLLQLLLPIKVD